MGRAILIVVLLVSTIYAGIIINVQKEMYKLPIVIRDNFINKEAENMSDYALRAAVRLGTEQTEFQLPIGVDTMTVFFDGGLQAKHFPVYRHYKQGIPYDIKKITYKRTPMFGDDLYEATVMIERPQMTPFDPYFTYTAQIGYQYPDPGVDGPLLLFGRQRAQAHLPDIIEDISPQVPPTDGYLFGLATPASNVFKFGSQGVWGNGSGSKCFEFGHSTQKNGVNNTGCAIQVPDPTNVANYALLINRLKTYNQFSVSCYAVIERESSSLVNQGSGGITVNGNSGTLYWAASNPNNSKFGQPGYTRPSIALWYDNYVSGTVTMHYGITIDDTTAAGTYYEIAKTLVPTFTKPKQGTWHMFTITFNNGVLTAYYDTAVVGTLSNMGGTSIQPNDYGFVIGMRDIRANTPTPLCPPTIKHAGTNYMFYNGLIDYLSGWDIALTPAQIEAWYNGTIGRTVKSYIRD